MDKEQLAIARLQDAARLSEHRYKKPLMITYSGGKDSQVLVALAERAGINFEVVNSHTTADAPETVYHPGPVQRARRTRDKMHHNHADVQGKAGVYVDAYTEKLVPPTRIMRYCCAVLKETTGHNRFIATGVRWAESTQRKLNRGIMEINHRDKEKRIVMMADNSEKRQLFETCALKGKMTVNPIVDWSDENVWDYMNAEHLPVNPLYCEGQKRVGCVGCPMAGKGGRQREFVRWPAYEKMYISAFDRMVEARKQCVENGGKIFSDNWETGRDVFHWWIEDGVLPGQVSFDDIEEAMNAEI